jgi:ribbon-helix-helix CopG family protein
MKARVQVRLDRESREALEKLTRRLSWSTSQAIREGIRLPANCYGPSPSKVIGVGQFASGVPDLGSNKKYLKGFGRL